jgi:hypothetical protein
MRYLVAIVGFAFCFLGTLCIFQGVGGGIVLLLTGVHWASEEFMLYELLLVVASLPVGVVAGWHSYRATIKRYRGVT